MPGVLNQAVMPVKFGARPRLGRFVLLAMNTGGFCGDGGGPGRRGASWSSSAPAARCPLCELPCVGGGAGRLLSLQPGVGGGELVLVLAAQMLQLGAGGAGRLNVVLERGGVAGDVALQRAEPVEGDGQRGDAQHDAGHLADRGQVAAQRRPRRGGALGHHGQHEERDGDAERVEERDEERGRARHGGGRPPPRWR